MAVYTLHEHLSGSPDPQKKIMPPRQKTFYKEMAHQGLKPGRIRNVLKSKFQLPETAAPTLRMVQNLVNYYRRTKLGQSDRHDKIKMQVHASAFTGQEQDTYPFMFGWDLDVEGRPIVGNGPDTKPFLVGITSKSLLKRLDRDPTSFILHIDATFKLNQVSYPVLVIGMSDRARRFHLSGVVVLSQIVEEMYTKALAALKRVFYAVTGKCLRVHYIMGDADNGQYNAIQNIFGQGGNFIYLMCFFHVLKNVNERLTCLDDATANITRTDIYNLHFSESSSDFVLKYRDVSQRWQSQQATKEFGEYFKTVWLTGKFVRWQCFQSPTAYATTNNPAEQFNRLLKRDYTLRAKLKMGSLLQQLQQCCKNEGERCRPFTLIPEATDPLRRRSIEMERKRLLLSADSGLSGLQENPVVHVWSRPAPRLYVQSKDRAEETLAVTAQLGVNYARMEFEGMPPGGWEVDVLLKTCPCRFFYKFATCVHLLFALRMDSSMDSSGHEMLVNRSISRKRTRTGMCATGRPPLNGPALSLT